MGKYNHSSFAKSQAPRPAPSPGVPTAATAAPELKVVTAPVVAPQVTVPAPTSPAERFFKVTATSHVPLLGAHFVLPVGKVISSAGYDIQALLTLGVPLEEVTSGENARRALVLK